MFYQLFSILFARVMRKQPIPTQHNLTIINKLSLGLALDFYFFLFLFIGSSSYILSKSSLVKVLFSISSSKTISFAPL